MAKILIMTVSGIAGFTNHHAMLICAVNYWVPSVVSQKSPGTITSAIIWWLSLSLFYHDTFPERQLHPRMLFRWWLYVYQYITVGSQPKANLIWHTRISKANSFSEYCCEQIIFNKPLPVIGDMLINTYQPSVLECITHILPCII